VRPALSRDRQRQAEPALLVGPPPGQGEPGCRQFRGHPFPAELRRHLGPHLFAVGERHLQVDGGQRHQLRLADPQVRRMERGTIQS